MILSFIKMSFVQESSIQIIYFTNSDNIAKMYNNIKFLDRDLKLNADEILLDLLYGEVYKNV